MNNFIDAKKRKVMINLCLTGMIPTKAMNFHTPVSPSEIVTCALRCVEIGVSIVHIHARDVEGKPTWRKDVYAEIISGIREKNKDVILCVSTSGRDWREFEKRSECLELKGDLKPDMASLTLGSMNFINQESVNSPDMIERLALKMRENDIKPEIEIFEPGMIHKAKYLIQKGILEDKSPYFNILLGSLGTMPLDSVSFGALMHLLPDNAVWSAAGIGMFQLDANILGISLGGNVRVGLEDNIYFDREKMVLASNETLVDRIKNVIQLMDLEIASPVEARKILGL